MIISMISSVIGLAGGLLPDLFKEFRDSREHGREIERMDKTAELQLKMVAAQTDAKLAEIEGNVVVEEMKALKAQWNNIYKAQKPIGVAWIDSFNAFIRPFAALCIIFLFIGTAGLYVYGVLDQLDAGLISATQVATIIWASLIGDSIQAVLGFLFGYRTTKSLNRRK